MKYNPVKKMKEIIMSISIRKQLSSDIIILLFCHINVISEIRSWLADNENIYSIGGAESAMVYSWNGNVSIERNISVMAKHDW